MPHRRVLWRRPCRQSECLEFLSQRSLAAGCTLPVRAEGCHHEKLPKHTHAASTYGIAPARRARPWIPYGPSEQSRRAPQLGQRSWQACMSIIVCPHMWHSFFLPADIHQTPGNRLILLILADTALAAIRLMRACTRVAACLLG